MSTKPVKQLKNAKLYSKLETLKLSYIFMIKDFWLDNTWTDKIILEDIGAGNSETRDGNVIISLHPEYILVEGSGDTCVSFSDTVETETEYKNLCIEDLDFICDLINNYVDDFNKTFDKTRNENF